MSRTTPVCFALFAAACLSTGLVQAQTADNGAPAAEPALGKIYGVLFALFTTAAGLGPYLIRLSFVSKKGYDAGFGTAAALMLVAGAAIVALGPYRYHLSGATGSNAQH